MLLLSNKEEHADQAIEELKRWGDASKIHWVKCNLEDLKQVDEVAKKLKSEEKQIDAVCPQYLQYLRICTNTVLFTAHLQRRTWSRSIQRDPRRHR